MIPLPKTQTANASRDFTSPMNCLEQTECAWEMGSLPLPEPRRVTHLSDWPWLRWEV